MAYKKSGLLTYRKPVEKPKRKMSGLIGGETKNDDPFGYVIKSLGAGLAGVFEGVYDVVVGTTAQLTGNEAYADYLHKTAVVGEWKQQLDEEHNPGKGMKFIGDVASGIGQSSAFLLEGVAPGLGWAVFGTGVAGGGVSEAYQKTGELGAKEYIYGASRGLVEAALEKYVGAGGQMVGNLTGKVAPSLTKKVVSAIAGKTAGQAVWKGVAKSMISAGAGEFVEEFLGDYIDVALQRVTGVDKEASTTLKEAVYSGLVGLVSGAIMGGVTKSINVGMSYRSGSKVAQNGNAETLIKTAKVVADSFQTKDAAKLPETLSQLKDAVAQYENTANKESATAKIKLGEIKTYLAITEVFSGVQDVIAKIDQSDAKPYAEYMSDLTGKTVTVEDFKADKDNVKTNYAIQAWAALFLKDSKAEKATRRFNDIIQADKEGRPAPKGTIEGWSGEETVISLGQEYVNIIKDGAKYNVMWGQSPDNVTGIKGLSQAEVKTNLESMRKYFEAREAEVQTAREIYNATEQDAARDVIRDFDTLSPETRGAVIEWVKSAQGLDRDVVSAVSFIMSVRPGLQVLYAELGEGHKGLYANLPEVGRRLIVTSGDAKAVRETIAHELTHDLRQSKGWDTLKKYALRTVKESERQRIEKLYTDTLGLDASAVEEEVVAKVVGKALSSKVFLQRYAQKHNLVRIAQTIKQLAQYFKTKGADKLTLKESYALMSLVDGIIKTDYVKGQMESVNKDYAQKFDNDTTKRYNLDDIKAIEQAAKSYFGSTYSWKETGYITTDGTRLDFSGKKDGARAGQRSMDHREILEAFGEDANISGTEAMIRFMSAGNVRIMPESGGINLSVRPTKAQEDMIARYAETFRGEIIIDFDDTNGDTKASVEYPKGTRSSRVIQDIRNYFDSGIVPEISDVQRFRYNLDEDSEGNTLSPEQIEFFKDSKVRDKDGKLLVVYHGTNAEFNKFDKSMTGYNTGNRGFYGSGFYFATTKRDAANYGEKIIEVYLNSKKLFDIDNKDWTYTLGIEEKPQHLEVAKTELEDLGNGFYTVYYTTKDNPDKWEYIRRASSLELSEGVEKFVYNRINPESRILPRDVKNLSDLVQQKGYDGIIGSATNIGDIGKEIVVFSPEQIKLTTNKNPTQNVDIRYDLADSQVKKYKERAEYWKSQVTQDEIANADEVRKIARELKTAYNSKYKTTAQELSALYDYMAKDKVSAQEAYEKAKSIAEGILSESYELSPEYETYRGIRAYVMGNKLKVNDTIKGDIADYNDWRKHNIPFGISEKGIPVDIAYMELSEIYGEAYFPDIANPTDQLLHIVDQMANSKNKMVPTLFENIDAEAAYIAESIIDDYQAIKQPTYRGKQAEKFNRAMMAIKVIANADRAKNLFKSKRTRGILAVPEWNELTKLAKDVRPRFNINVKNARLFAGQFAKFITRHGEDFSFYVDSDLADKLLTVAQGNGALTAEEMAILNAAYYAMFAMDSRVDRIYKDGKWVDTEPDAKQAMDGLHDQYEGKITKGMANNTTRLIKYIVENALDPEDATRMLEGVLSGGVLSKSIHEIKLAYERAEQAYDRYTKEAEEFIENNKDFWKSFNEDSVELKVTRIGFKGETVTHNLTLTKGEAMQLYMTTKREQAKAALALGRIRFDDQTKRGAEFTARILKQVDRKVYGDMTDVEFQEFAQVMYDNMALAVKELEFSEIDKKFIEIMEKFYNGLSKEEKAKMDDIRWGKTNVIDSYYVPLTRSSLARDINLIQPRTETMTVRSYSFNKDTVQGANAQLVIGDAYQIFKQHARQLSKYVELTIPLENFQRIYNYKFEDGTADVYSVREYQKTYVWDGVDNYYKNYLQDVQGTRARDDTVSRTFQKVKGAFAKAAIGANVSSFLKQFSSTIMMMTEVDFDSWVKGIRVINADVMDKYSMLAANRNSPNAQYYAQGATGRLGKIGQATMWLMKKGDRSACYTMWSMCQHQAAKEGLALGTEENFVRAGELLNDAILSVQDTGSAPTKSGIARSPQEAVSALTMFRSAPIKMASKTFIAAAEYKETLRRRKAGKMTDADVSGARKKLQRVLTAITAVALFEAVVGVTLAKLRGKYDDEEEEKIVEKLTKETALNLVGLVPVIGQIAESWLGGYESSFFYYDILNDGLGTLKNFYDMGTNIISGEVVETATWMRNLRKLAHFFGTATGIPVRNIDNHLTMVIRSVSPGAAYKYNALFYDTGMTQTLRAAIAKGKDGLALAVLDNLYSERTGKYSREISEIQADLYKQGYNVVPPSIPKTYKVGDEELNVTSLQYKRIKELYSEATVIVAEIIQKDEFKKLESEAQAKVIRTAYNSALDSAKHQVLGTEMSKVTALLGLVDPVTLLLGYSYITTLTGLKADRAKAYVRKYDKFTQAAILYSAGYSTIDIKNTLNKTIVALDNGDEILKALGI